MVQRTCEQCGAPFLTTKDNIKRGWGHFCSHRCVGASRTGEKAAGWKGGRYVEKSGYVMLTMPDGSKMFEHRYVMEQHLGRPLLPTEEVHHRRQGKEAKSDNRIENLLLTSSKSEHMTLYHGAGGRWSRDYDCCIGCGTTDYKHNGHGLCGICSSKKRHRDTMAQRPVSPPRWAKDYDACIDCGTMEREHYARGLCSPCYQRRFRSLRK
jgi:hypothetical protein